MESVAVTRARRSTRVLLTGATGFIGSHVARLLVEQGQEVIAVIRPTADRWRVADIESRLIIVDGDLSAPADLIDRLRPRQPEICIHLAWRGWSGKPEADANVSSLAMGLELLRRMPELSCRRFVTVGTCFEYNLTGERLSENSALGPHDLYGACKWSLFEVARHYSGLKDVSVVCPRIFYTYGPYEDARRLVPSVALALLRGTVARVTPGQQVRDYLHVEDVASAIWATAQSDITGAVNVASGEPISVAAMAVRIGELLDSRQLVQLGALQYRDGEPMHILGDATVLRDRLGWSPRFDLDRGLTDTLNWWRGRETGCAEGSRR